MSKSGTVNNHSLRNHFYPLDSSNDHLAANSNLNPLDPSSELENLTVVDYSHNLGEIVDSA